MAETVSAYNRNRRFEINFCESRLKKAAGLIRSLTPGRFLDIGCATGEWMRFWAGQGWQTYGLDVNPEAVAAARRQGSAADVCDLAQGPLPYADGFFDLVFAGEVIEHVVDTDAFLREAGRCLKPGGYLLLTTPNLASFENRLRLLLGRYPQWVDYRLSNCGHVRAYTPAVLKRHLRDHGFRVLQVTGNWVPFLPQAWIDDVKAPWLAVTGGWFPGLAMDIILLAQKNA